MMPATRPFLESEGVIRPGDRADRNGNIMGDCIAHVSKSQKSCSYKLNGQIYCFGCGFKGDLIDFVKRRYHLDFRGAAKRLGAWRDSALAQEERSELDRQSRAREEERARTLQAEMEERQRRLALRNEIHQDTQLMKDLSGQLSRDIENETLWECLQLASNCRELTEREYMRACGFEVDF